MVSIHAPARGATWLSHPVRGFSRCFNPRSREGSDRFPDGTVHGWRCFNPRSREGSDPFSHYSDACPGMFQSTLPRGERHHLRCSDCFLSYVSIHAPARGATIREQYASANGLSFNPRSREGSDNRDFNRTSGSSKFQSTLPRGERRSRLD